MLILSAKQPTEQKAVGKNLLRNGLSFCSFCFTQNDLKLLIKKCDDYDFISATRTINLI